MSHLKKEKWHAVVAGATGLVGRHCLEQILNHPGYERVTVLTRRQIDLQHPLMEQRIIQFKNLKKELENLSGEHLYCCLGTTIKKAGSRENFREVDYLYPKFLAEHAAEKQYSQFLAISALGANARSPFFYNRVKGELEESLKTLSIRGIHIFRPSLLLGKRNEWRSGEWIAGGLLKIVNPLLFGRAAKYRPIHAAIVARAMVGIAAAEIPGYHIYESNQIQFFVDQMGGTA